MWPRLFRPGRPTRTTTSGPARARSELRGRRTGARPCRSMPRGSRGPWSLGDPPEPQATLPDRTLGVGPALQIARVRAAHAEADAARPRVAREHELEGHLLHAQAV